MNQVYFYFQVIGAGIIKADERLNPFMNQVYFYDVYRGTFRAIGEVLIPL